MHDTSRIIKTVLIPIGINSEGQKALSIAQTIAEEVILVGVVPIPAGEPLSPGAQAARQIRKLLLSLSSPTIRFKSTVIVSETPWVDLQSIITQEKPDLFMIDWIDGHTSFGITVLNVLSNSLCNVAIVGGTTPVKYDRALIAVRGGPYAELAFQVGMSLQPCQVDVLHLALTSALNDAPFKGLKRILDQIPEVNLRSIVTDDIAMTILEESNRYDVVVLGATAGKNINSSSIGPVAEKLLRESRSTVMVVKTQRPISESMFDEKRGGIRHLDPGGQVVCREHLSRR